MTVPQCVTACAAMQCILCHCHLIFISRCGLYILQRCQRALPLGLGVHVDMIVHAQVLPLNAAFTR